jgi:hypothetical protein
MKGKVKCTCGWSWNKSDSSKKDMYICHECGRDNSNNMKNGGWLDNYGEEDNYNDSEVSLPEGFVGEGIFNGPKFDNPAWGGQFEEGGVLPGATGHMYARHGAPSNGKYAKKTLPSAQDGKKVKYGTPEYEEAYNKGEVISKEGEHSPILLDEVVIQNNYKRPRGFWEQYRDKIVEENKDAGVLGAIIGTPVSAITSLPQLAMMKGFTGKMERPSEAIGFENKEGLFKSPSSFGKHASNFVLDAVTDPLNLVGAGILTKENALAKLAASKESGLLSNAYKLNPFAERLNNANKSYRVAGMDALEDFQNTGVLRSQRALPENPTFLDKVKARPTSFPSFQKGYADLNYLPNEGGVIFETGLPTFKRGEINPVTNTAIGGRHYAHRVINPETGGVLSEIPASDIKVFGDKPHWLQGYKEVPKPVSNFESEIDWAKWNKEIPENSQLIKEYNAIEQTSKANNTWMKNPDGSAFQGTPEQFVQQNSENFKKAFGNSKLLNPDGSPTIQYHGSAKKFDTFDESKFQLGDAGYSGSGIYTTPNKTKASSYSLSSKSIHKDGNLEPTIYELYGKGNNPISAEELIKQKKDYDLFNFHRAKDWQGDVPLERQMREYDVAIRNQTRGVERISPWNDADELVFPTNKQLKSATGNNGMFDMTNPNIYKAVIPGAIGLGALQQKRDGGIIKDDRGQWAHPGEITEIGSNNITMEGVPYDVLGISDEGDIKLMKPGKNYTFKGKKVTEFPMAKNGMRQEQKGLQNLDNLLNFSNYNSPKKGGWLEKYNI